jgi:hypothetical protein
VLPAPFQNLPQTTVVVAPKFVNRPQLSNRCPIGGSDVGDRITGLKVPKAQPRPQVPGPIPGTRMTHEYVRAVAQLAYVWGWPLVNSFNRRVGLTSCPERGLRGGILPNAPRGQICMLTDYIVPEQRFVTCSTRMWCMAWGTLRWMRSQSSCRYPTSATASGCTPHGMLARIRSRNSANSMEQDRASTS